MLTWLVWLSLAVALLVVAGATVVVVRRGLELWRQVKSTGGAVTAALDRIVASADEAAGRAEAVAGGTEKVDASLSRLAVSRARLAVLQRAWHEVRAPVSTATDYVPREKKA